MDGGSREERIALNEIAFRAANDALQANVPDPDNRGLDPCPFLCECGDRHCTRVIEIPLERYAEIREHPARFLVLPGHADETAEQVVEEADRFQVVEKHGLAGKLARSHWRSGRLRQPVP